MFLVKSYASTLATFFQSQLSTPERRIEPLSQVTCRVLELGCGHGYFGYQLARYAKEAAEKSRKSHKAESGSIPELCRCLGCVYACFRVVVTDFHVGVLRELFEGVSEFRVLAQKGWLDYAVVDLTKPDVLSAEGAGIKLEWSGERLVKIGGNQEKLGQVGEKRERSLLAIVANYALDSIPHDLYRVSTRTEDQTNGPNSLSIGLVSTQRRPDGRPRDVGKMDISFLPVVDSNTTNLVSSNAEENKSVDTASVDADAVAVGPQGCGPVGCAVDDASAHCNQPVVESDIAGGSAAEVYGNQNIVRCASAAVADIGGGAIAGGSSPRIAPHSKSMASMDTVGRKAPTTAIQDIPYLNTARVVANELVARQQDRMSQGGSDVSVDIPFLLAGDAVACITALHNALTSDESASALLMGDKCFDSTSAESWLDATDGTGPCNTFILPGIDKHGQGCRSIAVDPRVLAASLSAYSGHNCSLLSTSQHDQCFTVSLLVLDSKPRPTSAPALLPSALKLWNSCGRFGVSEFERLEGWIKESIATTKGTPPTLLSCNVAAALLRLSEFDFEIFQSICWRIKPGNFTNELLECAHNCLKTRFELSYEPWTASLLLWSRWRYSRNECCCEATKSSGTTVCALRVWQDIEFSMAPTSYQDDILTFLVVVSLKSLGGRTYEQQRTGGKHQHIDKDTEVADKKTKNNSNNDNSIEKKKNNVNNNNNNKEHDDMVLKLLSRLRVQHESWFVKAAKTNRFKRPLKELLDTLACKSTNDLLAPTDMDCDSSVNVLGKRLHGSV